MMKPSSARPTMIPSLWCGKRTCFPTVLPLGIAYAQPTNSQVTSTIAVVFTGKQTYAGLQPPRGSQRSRSAVGNSGIGTLDWGEMGLITTHASRPRHGVEILRPPRVHFETRSGHQAVSAICSATARSSRCSRRSTSLQISLKISFRTAFSMPFPGA